MTRTIRPALGASAVALTLGLVLTGCVPEAEREATASPTSTAPGVTPDASVPPSPTPEPGPEVALPASCEEVYSDAMLTRLQQDGLPLNDPGVSMPSSMNATLLELMDTIPTLRCSWGPPGDLGLTTNVSIVDAAQAAAVTAELSAVGFGCEQDSGALVCRIEQRGLTLDDHEYTRGEVHAVRGNLWIATGWLNFDPPGYTEDILQTLGS